MNTSGLCLGEASSSSEGGSFPCRLTRVRRGLVNCRAGALWGGEVDTVPCGFTVLKFYISLHVHDRSRLGWCGTSEVFAYSWEEGLKRKKTTVNSINPGKHKEDFGGRPPAPPSAHSWATWDRHPARKRTHVSDSTLASRSYVERNGDVRKQAVHAVISSHLSRQ